MMHHIPPELIAQTIFTILSAGISSLLACWFYFFKKRDAEKDREREARHRKALELENRRDKEYGALKNGMQSLLREHLIIACQEHERAGWIELNQLKSIKYMYDAYHALGGNDIVTALYEQVQKLPLVKPTER
jgi:hypothetical protein